MKQFHRFFFLVWHLWYHIRYDTLFDGLTVPAKFNDTRTKSHVCQSDTSDIVLVFLAAEILACQIIEEHRDASPVLAL